MAQIVFTHSYFYRLDPKQWKTRQPYPPLATLIAAAVMRESGHEVRLFDSGLARGPGEIQPFLDPNPNYLVIYDDGFNYLTKMCLTNMREAALEMAQLGSAKGATIIACSSDSTDQYQHYLDNGVDFVILGEGEETLKQLVQVLENDPREASTVAGLAFKEAGEVVLTGKKPVMEDLDSLPFAAWDLVNMEDYRRIWTDHHGYFSLNMATTRGCPFKCNWCAKPIYGNRYNTRSPSGVVEEIQHLINTYGPDHFWMCDDIFGLKPGWVQEFRDQVKARGLSFRFKIQSRVDLLVKEDTVEALAESGLEIAWVGAESGSQKILDAMDKGTRIDQIQAATQKLKQAGVRVGFFLQFGYLGEDQTDVDHTVDMVLELMPDEIGISVSYPLPGTKFFEKVKNQLTAKANWSDSDDLDLMYRGHFPPQYYKRLHRYVHKVYRQKATFEAIGKMWTQSRHDPALNLRRLLASVYYFFSAPVDRWRLNQFEKKAL